MKIIKKILLILLVVFIVSQIFGPKKNLGDMTSIEPFLNETNPPKDVRAILKESCYDCHSNITRYPWYNNITPVNYWLADHIKDGKKQFNMSDWVNNSLKRKDHKMKDIMEAMEGKYMPLSSYTLIHDKSNLTESQFEAVRTWAKGLRLTYNLELKSE